MKKITLTLYAREQSHTESASDKISDLYLKKSYELQDGVRSAGTEKVSVDVAVDDVVELIFDDDTKWLCPPDTLETVFPGSKTQNRSEEVSILIPSTLDSPDGSRSIVGKIGLKLLSIFGKKKTAKKGMRRLAKELEEAQLKKSAGLKRLTKDFDLEELSGIEETEPVLVFIHGTNSSTHGSFEEIKGSPLWKYITENYKEQNILAFQHRTLTESPLQNAKELIKALPGNCLIHLITHSRGGLVGEILGRYSDGNTIGFSADEMAMLEDEGRTADLECIKALRQIVQGKNFSVKKFIRVACPAAGTTILSRRLDHFFNISLNLLGTIPALAVSPVYQAMKELLIALIDQKNDVDVLPGLEVMKPDSPFINIINNQASSVSLDVPVVAVSGNCKARLNLRALVIIASKLFYLEDNDLVVNTQSMYNGSKRMNNLQYFFDEGTDVDHFNYFKNPRTNEAIKLALSNREESIPGFTSFTRGTVEEIQRSALLNLEGGVYSTVNPSGLRPIVVILPGIMGSTLARGGDRIWINYLRFLTGGLSALALDKKILSADGIVKTSYKELAEDLQKDYDVLTFPFDWRQSLKSEAGKLNDKIKELLKLGQPIKIIGHSMGGVLVRDFMVYHSETWKQLNGSTGFQLLFLGSPLRGSFRINTVLFGEDDIINKLSKIDIIHTKKRLVRMFVSFPGILSLLPFSTDEGNDFADGKVWQEMREAFGDKSWPLPSEVKNVLTDFKNYRDKILASTDVDFSNACYIAGSAPATPLGYRIEETARGRELKFLSTAAGDQSVTWESGIPKEMIQSGKVYYSNYSHGALSCTPALFGAIREILKTGKTGLLSNMQPIMRGIEVFETPPSSDFDYSVDGFMHTILGLETQTRFEESTLPLKVSVTHGDLKFSRYPVIAGHFENDGVLNAETRINKLLEGQLAQHHAFRIYPGAVGTHLIFNGTEKGFKGAIIVGLGEVGTLNGFELSRTVETAMIKYLMDNIIHNNGNTEPLGISSLVIANGFGGLSFDTSISSILMGISNANRQIKARFPDKYRLIEFVEFVDYYDNNAKNCLLTLRRLQSEEGSTLNIKLENSKIKEEPGGKRMLFKNTGADWWTRLVITKEKDNLGAAAGMRFSISTGSSREDYRVVYTHAGIIESLLKEISKDNKWSEGKAKALFSLLVPNDMKPRLSRQGNLILILDDYTAQLPWELLHEKRYSAKPLCVNAGMVRQLLTQNSRINIEMATGRQALVVGDPILDNPLMQLPAALKEAEEVTRILRNNQYEVEHLPNAKAGQIINALFSKEYKVVHLAGHGYFGGDSNKPSGMLIGGSDTVLTAAHIAQLDTVPELVFLNCCYLGESNADAEKEFQSRFKLAANLGSQLINNGTKAVVAAGWAINDSAAFEFCKIFYELMFSGYCFGDAVQKAREHIFNRYSSTNTWGAYQVYGDPYYKIKNEGSNYTQSPYALWDEARTDLANLLSEVRIGENSNEQYKQRLDAIIKRAEESNLKTEKIIEYEARILQAIGEPEEAIAKIEEILSSSNCYIRTVEQYCNIKLKSLTGEFIKADKTGLSQKERKAKVDKDFDAIITKLDALIQIGTSSERLSLKASAWKWKLLLLGKDSLGNAVTESAKYYQQAYEQNKNDLYTLSGWFTMEILQAILKGSDMSEKEVVNLFENAPEVKNSGDYWARIGLANIKLSQWLQQATNPDAQTMSGSEKVLKAYKEVWNVTGSPEEKEKEIQHLDIIIHVIREYAANHFSLSEIVALRNDLQRLI